MSGCCPRKSTASPWRAVRRAAVLAAAGPVHPARRAGVFLEAFEGPLDLLLYLIRKQNFNILDIPMADVTRQYLAYVEQIRKTNLELASEYLLMAAMLIEIKSRMLLPPKKTAKAGGGRPARRVVRRLIEYEQMKLAAARLEALRLGRDFLRAQWSSSSRWRRAFPTCRRRAARRLGDILRRARLTQHHTITREQSRCASNEHRAAHPARRKLSSSRACSTSRRRAGAGGDIHRAARAGARQPAGDHAGRGFAPIYVRLAYSRPERREDHAAGNPCGSTGPPRARAGRAGASRRRGLFELPFNELLFRAQARHREHFDPSQVRCPRCCRSRRGCRRKELRLLPASVHLTRCGATALMELDAVLEAARRAREAGADALLHGRRVARPKDRDVERSRRSSAA